VTDGFEDACNENISGNHTLLVNISRDGVDETMDDVLANDSPTLLSPQKSRKRLLKTSTPKDSKRQRKGQTLSKHMKENVKLYKIVCGGVRCESVF